MGFLDKVKEQGSALAAKAQEGVKQGQAKLDDAQARKRAEGLLQELGDWQWALHNGRDDGRGESEVARIMGELAAHEAEHGALPVPGVQPVPAPPAPEASTPPPPPSGGAEGQAPTPPPAAAAPPPPPVATPPAAPPASNVPPGGFTLDDM